VVDGRRGRRAVESNGLSQVFDLEGRIAVADADDLGALRRDGHRATAVRQAGQVDEGREVLSVRPDERSAGDRTRASARAVVARAHDRAAVVGYIVGKTGDASVVQKVPEPLQAIVGVPAERFHAGVAVAETNDYAAIARDAQGAAVMNTAGKVAQAAQTLGERPAKGFLSTVDHRVANDGLPVRRDRLRAARAIASRQVAEAQEVARGLNVGGSRHDIGWRRTPHARR
jgi:hypothetical protein